MFTASRDQQQCIFAGSVALRCSCTLRRQSAAANRSDRLDGTPVVNRPLGAQSDEALFAATACRQPFG